MISVNRLEWPPTNRWIELRMRRGKPLREGLCERAFQRTMRCAVKSASRSKNLRALGHNMRNPWYGTALALSCSTNHRLVPFLCRLQTPPNSAPLSLRRSQVIVQTALPLLSVVTP